MRRRLLAALIPLLGLLAACGGPGPSRPIAAALDRLKPIRSGVLQVEALFIGASRGPGGAGFNISGPFAEPLRAGGPPVTDLDVSAIGSGQAATTLISDGKSVVIERGGVIRPVTGSALKAMGYSTNADLVGLQSLGVAYWTQGPVRTTTANGAVTLAAAPDPVAAINGIVALAKEVGVGDGFHTVGGGSASVLRHNLASGSFSLRYGAGDHLLQFFWVQLLFRPAALPAIRTSLGPTAGPLISMSVSVSEVNQPQHVTVPPAPA